MSDSSSTEKSVELVSTAIEGDAELQAIRNVLSALVPLNREGRTRVLEYVLKRLGMTGEALSPGSAGQNLSAMADPFVTTAVSEPRTQANDIRSLTREKQPRSANEMAALVAFYVTELAPDSYRKISINNDDIKKYFKDAVFPLPSSPRMTLVNAKNAGYLESSGPGQYRLNPVGYNLVAHSLPAESSRKRGIPRKPKRNKAARKGH